VAKLPSFSKDVLKVVLFQLDNEALSMSRKQLENTRKMELFQVFQGLKKIR
jgi:hypothetical protein